MSEHQFDPADHARSMRGSGFWVDKSFDEFLQQTVAATPGKLALLADRAFHADSITAKGVVLEMERQADGSTGVGLQTEKLDATGIEAAGARVDAVHGDNVRAGGQHELAAAGSVAGVAGSAAQHQ